MAQTKLGGGRNWLKKVRRREKLAQKVGRREIYPLLLPPLRSTLRKKEKSFLRPVFVPMKRHGTYTLP